MESFMQVFNLVKETCHESISDVAFNLWIAPLEPVKFENGTAYLYIKSEFQKNIITDKYIKLLSNGFNQVLGFDVQIEILTEESEEVKEKAVPVELDENTQTDGTMPNGDYEYTFDTFIVGASNNFAVAACKAVASRQSGPYNPLFINGPSGLGKTHLLMAIRHEIQKNTPVTNILYVNGETFTHEFITAIENETTNQFHTKYRNADILLVDDIQFVAGKERTQEEFFHTFNELHRNGRQIVLASDRPPKDIKTLETLPPRILRPVSPSSGGKRNFWILRFRTRWPSSSPTGSKTTSVSWKARSRRSRPTNCWRAPTRPLPWRSMSSKTF